MSSTKSNKAKADAFFGKEPVLVESATTADFVKALNWLRSEQTPETTKKWIQTFMVQSKYEKGKIEKIMSNLKYLSATWYSVAKLLTNGSKLPSDTKLRLDEALSNIVSFEENEDTKTPPKTKRQVNSVPSEVLEYIDGLLYRSKNEMLKEDVYAFLMEKNVTKLQADELCDEYQSIYRDIVISGDDPEVRESYEGYSKTQLKNIRVFLVRLYAQLQQFKVVKQARKQVQRKPRKVNKDKLVSKLKYMKESTEYRVSSVDPTKLLGAKTAVTFNTKTREVSIFYGFDDGLSVKGTTLISFDTEKSVSKRLRKPNDVLSHGVRAGLENAFAAAKTKSRAANGRMNENIIIVKVWN
jgi:hypothetical protein